MTSAESDWQKVVTLDPVLSKLLERNDELLGDLKKAFMYGYLASNDRMLSVIEEKTESQPIYWFAVVGAVVNDSQKVNNEISGYMKANQK